MEQVFSLCNTGFSDFWPTGVWSNIEVPGARDMGWYKSTRKTNITLELDNWTTRHVFHNTSNNENNCVDRQTDRERGDIYIYIYNEKEGERGREWEERERERERERKGERERGRERERTIAVHN